jgi:UDP:flavonoid glycosyltransferase YjiC (YdhE family)
MFGKLFGAMATPPMLEGLELFALDWRPHLVVADAGEFAGHIVAASLGIPSVTKGFGPLLPEVRVASAAEEVAALWTSRRLEPRPYGGAYDHLYIDIYPPELQVDAGVHVRHRQLMRPVTADGAADEPTLRLPRARGDAPLVYVTMGTVFNDPEPLRRAVEGVRTLDVRVLATVGPAADPAVLGDQPGHVVVESYVPQTAVLPHCDMVVSHGGSGTVLSALTLGLPQVCLPQGADQFLNAGAVAASGAGLSITPDAASCDSIRDAVATVLGDESYRTAAQRVAASIDSMPPVDDVAAVLERLA